MCGEKTNTSGSAGAGGGSPPRVRGKAQNLRNLFCQCGITPACAGKSQHWTSVGSNPEDHPRVCGEKASAAVNRRQIMGSPPRVRGKVSAQNSLKSAKRITPACAGKSFPRRARHGCRWDHPRVCGEKTWTDTISEILSGSPPRVRGKGRPPFGSASARRITPACAGKSGLV